MHKRIKTIKRYYEALEYEINKEAALNKISALHYELKSEENNNFLDRFSRTASIIEENLSVFKSACDHVDIITTILDFLYTVSGKLMFDNECTYDEINIIYIMYIVCEEHEIPSFLKAALINNSRLEFVDGYYRPLILNYVYEMIVCQDSDLYAVISHLRVTPFFLLKIYTIFVQESIKQKFLWLLEKYFPDFYTYMDLPISIFRTKKDLYKLPSYFVNLKSMNMVSIWSEDITAAKVLATTLRRDITFINAHFEFGSNIKLSWKWSFSTFNLIPHLLWNDLKDGDKINPNDYTGSVYELFYNGVWQRPVKNEYWIHNNNTYAHATKEDMFKCIKLAEEAFKNWSIWPIVSRRKMLENLASTLECNGKFLLASTVISTIQFFNIYCNNLKCHDERLEIISFPGPKGIVSIYYNDETALFSYLTLSLMIGNCVIVLHNKNSCTLAPYLNMFSTVEIPPGVLNLLSNGDMCNIFTTTYEFDDVVKYCTSINHIIFPLK